MGIFDFWTKRKERAAATAATREIATGMILNSRAGGGLAGLFVSAFERDERLCPERHVFAREIGTLRGGKLQFVAATRAQAADWLMERFALRHAVMVDYFEHSGGAIIFSTDVQADLEAPLIEKAKALTRTWLQRLFTKNTQIEKAFDAAGKEIAQSKEITEPVDLSSFSVGNFFRGRWKDPTSGVIFTEKSLSIEIFGIPTEALAEIAEALRREFGQKMVLIKDYKTNKVGRITG